MSKPEYENPIDLFSVFSGKRAIKEFIEYMFNKNHAMCKVLEKENNGVIYPIVYEENISMIQIDYMVFVYYIGSFFAEKSGNKFDVNRIIYDFGLSSETVKKVEYVKNRSMLMYMFEIYFGMFNNFNYKRMASKVEPYSRKIIKKNDVDVEFKSVSFNKRDMKKYVDFEIFLDVGSKYFKDIESEQVVFGSGNVSKYWMNSEGKKKLYLMIKDEDFEEAIDDDFVKNRILFNFEN